MELALIFHSKCLQYIICGHRQTYVRTNLWGHKRCVDTKCVRTHNGRVRVQCLSSSKTLQQHFSTLFFLQTCSSKILQRFMGISLLWFSYPIIITFTITTFRQTISPSSLPCSSSSVLLSSPPPISPILSSHTHPVLFTPRALSNQPSVRTPTYLYRHVHPAASSISLQWQSIAQEGECAGRSPQLFQRVHFSPALDSNQGRESHDPNYSGTFSQNFQKIFKPF